eukprot:gene42394-52574_t
MKALYTQASASPPASLAIAPATARSVRHTVLLAAMLGGLPAGAAMAASGACDTKQSDAPAGKAQEARPQAVPSAKGAAPRAMPMVSGAAPMPQQVMLAEGKSLLRQVDWPVARYAVGDPCVADVMLVNPQQLYLLGKRPGTTNVILWNKNGDAAILDLAVSVDTAVLKASYAMLPEKVSESLRITPAGDTIIVSGTVADAVQADQVLAMANAHLQRSRSQGGMGDS